MATSTTPHRQLRGERDRRQEATGEKTTPHQAPGGGTVAITGHRLAATLLLAMLLLLAASSGGAAPVEHAALQGPFASVAEVTAACLQCHPETATAILESVHWRWQRQRTIDGKPEVYAKLDGLTNFGVVARSNPGRCLGCHISISPSPEAVENGRPGNIDCLVCHDTSHTYRRAGQAKPAELLNMARSAGRPAPENCMTCHALSCGLGSDVQRVDFATDVHLSPRGANMSCQDCHPSGGRHRMTRRLSRDRGARPATGCQACHTDSPHSQNQLNHHAELISCQACHIPEYGRSAPVLMAWNWLLSGQTAGVFLKAGDGRAQLLTGNGFLLASKVEPVYRWDNGNDLVYRRGDRTRQGRATVLQEPGPRRPDSRLRPFAVQYGTQLYDARYRYLVSPQLAAAPGNMFPDTDWESIARAGMNSFRLPYSGQHDFTVTLTYRRLNHGTLPAAQALDCMDCHGSSPRMDWQDLGYEQDPWTDKVRAGREPMIATPETGPTIAPGKALPPIRETVLPVGPDR